jgi:hypothetical protein
LLSFLWWGRVSDAKKIKAKKAKEKENTGNEIKLATDNAS